MIGPRVRVVLVLLLVLVLQRSLLVSLRVGHLRPDAMLLLAIAAGAVAGSEAGGALGFAAGLVADLFAQTPLGLSALTFALVAFAVGTVEASLIRAAWWITPLTALLASAAGVVLFALVGAVVGHPYLLRSDLVLVAAAVGSVNAVLSPVMVRLVAWAMPQVAGERNWAA